MQIFQRGVNESLMIGPNVVVTVLEITPHCVRIAVQNPDATPSYREETIHLNARDVEPVMTIDDETESNRLNLALSGSRYLGW
jgi:carbon storage regulator CsrA